jgi:hypothetical protein
MTISRYMHACDASAAAAVSGTTFFAAASDEECLLRVYDRGNPGRPVSEANVAEFLELDDPDDLEADIEGVAQLGDRMYWIGSHGRSKKSKVKKNRQRLFATTIDRTGAIIKLRTVDRPYKRLLTDLSNAPALEQFGLAAAAEALKSPEDKDGFNIEGLAPAREQGQLLIGFRNPIPQGMALIVRLANAAALVRGTADAAELAVGGVLDLRGRGIRALEFVPSLDRYLVLAGAFDNSGMFQLYEWSGTPDTAARLLTEDMGGLNPEELLVVESTDRELTLQLLSDDGTDECKEAPIEQRSFRALTVRLQL